MMQQMLHNTSHLTCHTHMPLRNRTMREVVIRLLTTRTRPP